MNNIYFVVLSIYLPVAVVGSTIPSWNLTGKISVMCALSFFTTQSLTAKEFVPEEQETSLLGKFVPLKQLIDLD